MKFSYISVSRAFLHRLCNFLSTCTCTQVTNVIIEALIGICNIIQFLVYMSSFFPIVFRSR